MKKIFDNSEIANVFGLIAIILIVWLGGPYMRLGETYILESRSTRLYIIGILLIIWIVRVIVLQYLKYLADKKIVTALTDANDSDKSASEEHKALIRKNASLIMKTLNQGRGIFGKWFSSKNPWFIVTGLPHNGKSVLLEKAGLQRPVYDSIANQSIMESQKEKIGCWWFSENTFFLEVNILKENKTWGFDFMDALKKYRHYAPVSGIVLVDDISQLLAMSNENVVNHARELKAYLKELHHHLGLLFPIHLIFTQCDRIAGFSEYFNHLTLQDREKAFGLVFNSEGSEDIKENFAIKYDEMVVQLRNEVVFSLNQLDASSSALAINFPQQIALLKQPIAEFLNELFKKNGEEFYTLQGIYFSSATQEGIPSDHYLKHLSSAFHLSEQKSQPKMHTDISYFLYHIFKTHIFENLDKVVYNKKTRWMFKASRIVVYAFSLTIVSAYTVFYTRSYIKSVHHLDDFKNSITTYQRLNAQSQGSIHTLPDLLPEVDVLKNLGISFHEEEETRSHGYSFYSTHKFKKIHSEFKEALYFILYHQFMPLIFKRVETLLTAEQEDLEKISQLLKAYLAFSGDYPETKKMIPVVMKKDIETTYKDKEEAAKKLMYYLNLSMEREIPRYPLNEALIREKQKALNQSVPLDRIYKRLQELADKKYPLPYVPSYNLAPEFYLVFRSKTDQTFGIPVFYTAKGFQEVFQTQGPIIIEEVLKEDTLIGLDKNNPLEVQSKKELLYSLHQLYITDYIAAWRAFLEDQEIIPLRSLEEVIKVLSLLVGKQNLLVKLLDITSTHLSSVLPNNQIIDREYAEALQNLISLAESQDKKPPEIQAIMAPMVRMIDFLTALTTAADSDKACFTFTKAYLLDQATPNPIKDVKLTAQHLPFPLKEWIEKIADVSWDLALQKATIHINKNWKADIWKIYEKEYLPFYPINRTADQEISLASFKKMFGPNGMLQTFYEAYIQPLIGLDGEEWRWIGSSNESIGIARDHLKAIESALSLQKDLFDESGNLSLTIDVKPHTLDPNLASITFECQGQSLVYRHGPLQTKTFHWPARNPSKNTCQVTMVDFKDQNTNIMFEGLWALFRMLNRVDVSSGKESGSSVMAMSTAGYKAQFMVRSSPDIKSILSRLNNLHLPENLCNIVGE